MPERPSHRRVVGRAAYVTRACHRTAWCLLLAGSVAACDRRVQVAGPPEEPREGGPPGQAAAGNPVQAAQGGTGAPGAALAAQDTPAAQGAPATQGAPAAQGRPRTPGARSPGEVRGRPAAEAHPGGERARPADVCRRAARRSVAPPRARKDGGRPAHQGRRPPAGAVPRRAIARVLSGAERGGRPARARVPPGLREERALLAPLFVGPARQRGDRGVEARGAGRRLRPSRAGQVAGRREARRLEPRRRDARLRQGRLSLRRDRRLRAISEPRGRSHLEARQDPPHRRRSAGQGAGGQHDER